MQICRLLCFCYAYVLSFFCKLNRTVDDTRCAHYLKFKSSLCTIVGQDW